LHLGHRFFFALVLFLSSTTEGFFLSQEKYIQNLLDHASLTDPTVLRRTCDSLPSSSTIFIDWIVVRSSPRVADPLLPFDYTWSGRRRWSSFSAPLPAMVFSLDAAVACGLRTRRHLSTPDQAPPAIFVELFDPPPLRLVRDRLDLFLQSDWLTRWLLFSSAHTASSARLTQFFDSAHAATSGSGLFVRFGFDLF
jgi:hypothetical protein